MTYLEKFNAFIKKTHIYENSPIIYDSISGFSEFGPYGATIKNNLIQKIKFEFRINGFWEVEHPIVMPNKVWEASGHMERFVDIIADSEGKIFRVDKIVEEQYPNLIIEDNSLDGIKVFLEKNEIIPKGHKKKLSNPREYWLMLLSNVANEEVTLRPETATATYSSFKEYYNLFRNSMPVKVFQFGKVFRNEVTSRQGLIRGREFEQIEGQIFYLRDKENDFCFIKNTDSTKVNFLDAKSQLNRIDKNFITLDQAYEKDLLKSKGYAYCFSLVLHMLNKLEFQNVEFRFRQHLDNEKAHYAEDAWDLEINTKQYGWIEVCGIHDRGNYDLSRHQDFSGKKLSINNDSGEKEIPSIFEIAFGVGRILYCLLEKSFNIKDEKNILSIPSFISPINVAILPLVKKQSLKTIALQIESSLRNSGLITFYDESGSIGKRYARMDELGTPFCITIDFESIDDSTVTIRFRDTGEQKRIHIDNLLLEIDEILN